MVIFHIFCMFTRGYVVSFPSNPLISITILTFATESTGHLTWRRRFVHNGLSSLHMCHGLQRWKWHSRIEPANVDNVVLFFLLPPWQFITWFAGRFYSSVILSLKPPCVSIYRIFPIKNPYFPAMTLTPEGIGKIRMKLPLRAHVLLTSVCQRYNGTVGETHTKTVCFTRHGWSLDDPGS